MGIFQELQDRGLVAQMTNPEKIQDMLDNQSISFYIGFDPTADSLHVGHFMQMVIMKHLQMAGHKPIALLGEGTGMIGDPSGRTDMRQMLTHEQVRHNIECFKKQMGRFIDTSDGKAMFVNNADWLMPLNYIEFLRDIDEDGQHKCTRCDRGDPPPVDMLGASTVFDSKCSFLLPAWMIQRRSLHTICHYIFHFFSFLCLL